MEIKVKVKYGASKQRIENYGNNKYLVYFEGSQNENTNSMLISLLSRYLGTPASRINFQKSDIDGNKVFDIS